MRLAYIDESGDSGYGGSRTYTLGCVLIEDTAWPDAFDSLIGFRRFLKSQFGIRVRDEIKANYLIRNSGPLRQLNLGDGIRRDIYRQHMRLAPKIGLDVFSVVINKGLISQRKMNPRDIAWEFLLQRIERLSTKTGVPVLITHDEGEDLKIRALARKARRANTAGSAFGTGRFKLPARLLIDDPVSRQSHQSYFIQLADLAAFAAYRKIHPPQKKSNTICDAKTWDQLATSRYAQANEVATRRDGTKHPGIVVWPQE